MPLLGDSSHQQMIACLQNIAATINKPSAIVVVSAHWETAVPTITAGANPSLIYDYFGFPEESYAIQYPCAGAPDLAKNIQALLNNDGIKAELDDQRGFDHGLFVPLKIMYPDADIPCVQLSLVKSLNPAAHIAIGQALQSLSHDNILVIGSGFSFHNMKAFFQQAETAENKRLNHAFEDWLLKTCSDAGYTEAERRQLLINWADAPGARFCHPREEHLLPLHVCYGLAQSPCTASFELEIFNKKASMYLW